MPLIKKLCIKCWNKRHIVGGNMWKWEEGDELRWKDGEIFCPSEYLGEEEGWIRKTTDKPPIKCPYYLEHTI